MTKKPLATENGKERILQAAETLFVNQGFDGTSVTQIAKQAQVTRSLIFHHFENKRALWEGVKKMVLSSNDIGEGLTAQASLSLDNFIDIFVTHRFNFYRNHPSFTRIIAWQSLEIESIVRSPAHIEKWRNPLELLQQKGLITNKYQTSTLLALIIAATTGFMVMHLVDFIGEENIEQYLELITHEIRRVLEPDQVDTK